MEPTALKIKTRLKRLYQHFESVYKSGYGADTIFETHSRGWFVVFEGSWEGLYVGETKPDMKPGDLFEITIRKANDKPSRPSE